METLNHITKMFVKHSTNTSDENAPNGESWIDYWKSQIKIDIPSICPCCKQEPTEDNQLVGAHVEEWVPVNNNKTKHFITPTCDKCNKTNKYTKARKPFQIEITHLLEI